MKELARSYVWWPGLHRDLETLAELCQSCNELRNLPSQCFGGKWSVPEKVWYQVYLDFAGPVEGKLMVIVDASSKWPEVSFSSTTTSTTIEVLRSVFGRMGLPWNLMEFDTSCGNLIILPLMA